MRGVEGPVEQADAFNLHGGYDLLDLAGVGSFGEVWDAFDDGFRIHFGTWSSTSLRVLFPPGVSEGELDAGVDAGVAVSEEALEMWMALAPKSMERRGRRK